MTAVALAPSQPSGIIRAHRDHVRSPVDVLRLIVGVATIIVGIGLANLIDSALFGLSIDTRTALEAVPTWFTNIASSLLGSLVLTLIFATLTWSLFTRRYRRFLLLVTAAVGAGSLSIAVGHLLLGVVDPEVQSAFVARSPALRYSHSGTVHPGDPLLAAAVAMLAIASNYLRSNHTRRAGAALGVYAIATTVSLHIPALGLVGDVGVGLTVGSIILLVAGRHDLAPDKMDLELALSQIGLDSNDLDPLSVDARASAPWMGHTADGQKIFIKAIGRDERSADLMFRLYRWIKLRKTGDHRPFVSLQRAVEHEALVSLQAAALGVQTPKILGVASAGIDGMVLAYEGIEGASADTFDDLDDDVLEAIWSMVSTLHAHRIAHRDLRLANIFIAADNQPMLIDFGFSELAASDQLLGTDVAELLASTAAIVGTRRAVAAAHRATGLAELERAHPWLQPSALSTATRQAIGGDRGLKPIRELLVAECGVAEEPLVNLQRVNPKTMFIAATIALSAWFLLPQLADIDNIWAQTKQASLGWAITAVLLSIVTYVAATTALLGAIPLRLKFLPALAAQLASSFSNRVTPAKVGGIATNMRYFQHHGVPTAVSLTAVGVNAIAGLLMHLTLTLTFLLMSSSGTGSSLPIPSPAVVGFAGAAALAVIALSTAMPLTRRLIKTHVVPQLRAGWESIRTIRHSPGRLIALFGGSGLITLAYLGAMAASLRAFGATTSLPVIGLLFLTGSVVANAAPTPGGLGAAEAALIAAFSTVEQQEVAIPAVFLYRLVTFWLPIVPGWIALTWLRNTDRI